MGEGNKAVSTQEHSGHFLHEKRVPHLLFGTAVWEIFSDYECTGAFLRLVLLMGDGAVYPPTRRPSGP